MRRTVIAILATAVTASLALTGATTLDQAGSPVAAAATARPNILFIMVDDMRDDDLRFMPNTRRLIRDQGVRFANSFSPYPLCCPARTSVLTGLYTHNHGVYDVGDEYGFHAFDDHATLATMLHSAGYATVYVGKYLNRYGMAPPHGATKGGSLHYVPPGWDSWRAAFDGGFPAGSPVAGSAYNYMDTTLSRNGAGFQPLQGTYQTNAYGAIARDVVRHRAASPRPFFFYLSFTAPHSGLPNEADDPKPTVRDDGNRDTWHTPARPKALWGHWDKKVTQAPGRSWDDPDFDTKPPYLRKLVALNASEWRAELELTRQRAESLTAVDNQVRSLMRTLTDTGEAGNTLVVFTSDNGYFLGEQHRRQSKIYPHEPSLRVPLLMRGPGIPRGSTRRDPFTSVDFAPTLAAVAGTTPPLEPDGVSLWDVARHGDQGWTRAILTETGDLDHRPRDTDLAGQPLTPGESPDLRYLLGLRTPQYLYVDVADGSGELYDLAKDPKEYTNLVDDPAYADTLDLLRAHLAAIRACRGTTCATPMPARLQRPATTG